MVYKKMNEVRKTIPLALKVGKYFIAIAAEKEKILDYVYFGDRGLEGVRINHYGNSKG